MVLNTRRARYATVRTKSGILLGKLTSIDFDADTGRLAAIHVLPRGVVVGILSHELVIGWQYVVSMTEKLVIIEDGFVSGTVLRLAHAKDS